MLEQPQRPLLLRRRHGAAWAVHDFCANRVAAKQCTVQQEQQQQGVVMQLLLEHEDVLAVLWQHKELSRLWCQSAHWWW